MKQQDIAGHLNRLRFCDLELNLVFCLVRISQDLSKEIFFLFLLPAGLPRFLTMLGGSSLSSLEPLCGGVSNGGPNREGRRKRLFLQRVRPFGSSTK